MNAKLLEGDWSFGAVRVPATAAGKACTARCRGRRDDCVHRYGGSTAHATECNDVGFTCYEACPGASRHSAQGHGAPDPIEKRACTEGAEPPLQCMSVSGITAQFIDY